MWLSVCVRFRCVCVCVCVRFRCVHGKLLTQRSTVTPTILSILYARLVPSGSPYIESWYVRLNENARIGGNAQTDIMWKCGPCQKKYLRYWYFMHGIDASYHHTSYQYINESLPPSPLLSICLSIYHLHVTVCHPSIHPSVFLSDILL